MLDVAKVLIEALVCATGHGVLWVLTLGRWRPPYGRWRRQSAVSNLGGRVLAAFVGMLFWGGVLIGLGLLFAG